MSLVFNLDQLCYASIFGRIKESGRHGLFHLDQPGVEGTSIAYQQTDIDLEMRLASEMHVESDNCSH